VLIIKFFFYEKYTFCNNAGFFVQSIILSGWTDANKYWPVLLEEVDYTSGVIPQNEGCISG
jgi:hypothetical protein